MKFSKRDFLKITGLTILGIGIKPAINLFAQNEHQPVSPAPETLAGKRWAMLVNPKACTAANGCVDCIVACHRIHNVPDFGNPKDEVKWIWTEHYQNVFPGQENEYLEEDLKARPFITLCNHCDNPPCVRVCPTKATFRREDGIVMMDMHRCIGCRFCMAACPYGSRSFNWLDPRSHIKQLNPDYPTRMKGVVEKCTFCEERLAKGLIPACVEACKEKALIFGNLKDPNSEVRQLLRSHFTIRRKPELGTLPQVYYMV